MERTPVFSGRSVEARGGGEWMGVEETCSYSISDLLMQQEKERPSSPSKVFYNDRLTGCPVSDKH